MSFVANAYEAVTVAGTAIGFTAATYGRNTSAVVGVETAQIRFTIDGTTPTTTVGILADAGSVIHLNTADQIQKFKAIRTGGTSGTIRCTFGNGLADFKVAPGGAQTLTVDGAAISSSNPLPVAEAFAPAAENNTDKVIHVADGAYTAWGTSHTPAVNTQATCTKAAGGAGTKLVVKEIFVKFCSDSAPTAVTRTIDLIEDVAGTPATIRSIPISIPAQAGYDGGFQRYNCNIKATANKSLTLRFSSAGGANTYQYVEMNGYTLTEA